MGRGGSRGRWRCWGARLGGVGLVVALGAASLPALGESAVRPVAWQASALYGAEVRSLALDPRVPDRVLAGTSGGQVYLSNDGGASWRDAGTPLPFLGWVVAALRFDPHREGRLWAGMWGVWGGGLVAFSDDLGRSWSVRRPPPDAGQVYSLAVLPPGADNDTAQLLIGTRRGVFASRDDGTSWEHLTRTRPGIEKVTSLLVDPERAGTVYAGTWRCPYKSEDGGRSWQPLFKGMLLDSEVFSLTPFPGRAEELWASTCGWVYRSEDRGASWQRFREGMESRRVPSFAVLPGGRLLAGTVGGLFSSDDGGASWQRRTSSALAVLAIAVDPARPLRVLLGTEGSGVWRSEDGGASFTHAAAAMTNLRVAALARSGQEVLAAVNHAGPASGIYSSVDAGRSFQLQRADLPTVRGLASFAGKVYAATERGLFERTLDLDWRHVGELGEARIEGVTTGGGRLVVRLAGGLVEKVGERFEPVTYHHGAPRSLGLAPWALWVSDDRGLYRLTAGENHTLPVPQAGGSVLVAGGKLFYEGETGTWQRTVGEDTWHPLTNGPARLLPTGDPARPVLVAEGRRGWLAGDGPADAFRLPVAASDLTAAELVGGRLLLATAGYGVLALDLATP